jgi:sulfate adenylyltransferase subunit 1 (EFTu-like GTPase family)
MAAMKNFEITCPCCEATLVIDRLSGEVLLHKAKEVRRGESLDAMVAGLETQKSESAKRFDRQMESQKDRARILEERFKEALERAEKSDEKFINPMDMD